MYSERYSLRGTVGGPWRAKEHSVRAPAGAWSRAAGLTQLMLRPVLVFRPCVKSFRPSKVLCSFSSQHMRFAGERRRPDGADHPQLLLVQPRSPIDQHASRGRSSRVCDRGSRRYQRHMLVAHCPLTTRMSPSAAFALHDELSAHVARYGSCQWLSVSALS